MKVRVDDYGNEFIGEILKYCIDEDYIWFYDEISGGLYQLDKRSFVVEIVLTPMEIHRKKIFPVRQIRKWKNKIYLIPSNSSFEWLVYDITDKRLESILLSSQPYEIGNAVNIGKWIYLIPEKTNHLLAVVDADTLNEKIISTDWYKNNVSELWCWGNSVFEDTILFPIIGTGEIFQIQKEQITKLSLDIEQPIYSISLCENGIWILPCKGNNIFLVNRNGELMDSIEIRTNSFEDTVENFMRIIAVDKYVYLFPKQGGQILVLDTSCKRWIVIGEKDEFLYRSLYQKTKNTPYWGIYCNDGKIYTLPLQFRFAEISVENKSIDYKVLQYATIHMKQQYMSWVSWINKKTQASMYMDWEKNSLKNFLRITSEGDIAHNIGSVGKNIWMTID